jgi:hypothetical protein
MSLIKRVIPRSPVTDEKTIHVLRSEQKGFMSLITTYRVYDVTSAFAKEYVEIWKNTKKVWQKKYERNLKEYYE